MKIVELENGVWIAPWNGDPGRTLDRENAKKFDNHKNAKKMLGKAREHRQFKNALIIDAERR
jgi:hypothetical protein